MADHVFLTEQVFEEAVNFDFIHSHIDYIGFPLFSRMKTPHATTLHGRLDFPGLQNLFHHYSEEPVISISNAQRAPLPQANWQRTVYHGLPESLYTLRETPGRYLAFIGRMSPEKRVDHAIEIARRAGLPLKIAAKIDETNEKFFENSVKPLLNQGDIEFIGEIGEADKNDFLGNALALLFPIDWPEPFGMVMIEALACGTPVIARARGSVPEVIDHGKTGFVIEDLDDAVQAVAAVAQLSRSLCRKVFEERFSATRMATDYLAAYEELIRAQPRFQFHSRVMR
jgi:glycosyltransferase involved in cell wall biosynthesis